MRTTPEDCRLWLRTVQAGAFKTLFEVLKDMVHDVNVVFDGSGAKIQFYNDSKAMFIHVRLRADCFEQYHCDGKVICGINTTAMFKLIKPASNHDALVLYNRKDTTHELGIHIHSAERNVRTDFRLKLLDVNEFEFQLPEFEFDCVMTIPSVFFQRIIRDMNNLYQNHQDPSVVITAEGETLRLATDGDFASQETVVEAKPVHLDGTPSDAMAMTQQPDRAITGTYSLKHVNACCKAASLCNTAVLCINPELLVMKFNVYAVGEIQFLLGQKTDGDDFDE